MSSQKRRHWKAEEKLRIIEEARGPDSTISEACPRVRGGMPATWDRHRAVLCMGETCPSRSISSVTEREESAERVERGRNAKVRVGETSHSDIGTEHGEFGAKKGAMGIAPYRHYSSEEKELILTWVERVQQMIGAPVEVILDHLGVPRHTIGGIREHPQVLWRIEHLHFNAEHGRRSPRR